MEFLLMWWAYCIGLLVGSDSSRPRVVRPSITETEDLASIGLGAISALILLAMMGGTMWLITEYVMPWLLDLYFHSNLFTPM